ncbi:hypothetical protein SR39_13590 [Methylobacterium radiotolerans]|nr:hypothetical protein SR39_13590 [Methylobacterium radiotolerans]
MVKGVYGYQTYVQAGLNRLETGALRTCRSADDARTEAAKRVASGDCVGAAAFWSGIADADRLAPPVILEMYGAVPGDLADGLPF